jgi:homoserine kinase type II
MDHLAVRGIRCPTPVHRRDGGMLGTLGGRPAALTSFLTGRSPRRITADRCSALGRALAEMHVAGHDFPGRRANAMGLAAWRRTVSLCRPRANEIRPGLAAELGAELDALAAEWPRGLPEGIIHADLFPDNVFFTANEVSGLIDFYFACNDFYAYDVAICLNAWCFEADGGFNITKAGALLSGYRSVRPFSEDELRALPVLARGAAMRFLVTRMYDWLHHPPSALVSPKDPMEYWKRLRFHAGVRGPGAYGLD